MFKANIIHISTALKGKRKTGIQIQPNCNESNCFYMSRIGQQEQILDFEGVNEIISNHIQS